MARNNVIRLTEVSVYRTNSQWIRLPKAAENRKKNLTSIHVVFSFHSLKVNYSQKGVVVPFYSLFPSLQVNEVGLNASLYKYAQIYLRKILK